MNKNIKAGLQWIALISIVVGVIFIIMGLFYNQNSTQSNQIKQEHIFPIKKITLNEATKEVHQKGNSDLYITENGKEIRMTYNNLTQSYEPFILKPNVLKNMPVNRTHRVIKK